MFKKENSIHEVFASMNKNLSNANDLKLDRLNKIIYAMDLLKNCSQSFKDNGFEKESKRINEIIKDASVSILSGEK